MRFGLSGVLIVLAFVACFHPTDVSAQTCTASSQTFTTSGTFTLPAGCDTVVVHAWGGGGGGGAFKQAGLNRGGGGGGGGAYGKRTISGLLGNSTFVVTVGGSGSGGTYQDNVSWTNGTAGGDSSFANYLTARGGAGGEAGAAGNAAGGVCVSADLCYAGGSGGAGIVSTCGNDYRNGGGGGGGGGATGAGGNGGNATTNNCSGSPDGGDAGAAGAGGGGAGGHGGYNISAGAFPGGGGGGGCSASGGCAPGAGGAAGKVTVEYSATGGGGSSSSPWLTSATGIYYAAGYVGIGTTTPETLLSVRAYDADAPQTLLSLRKDNALGQGRGLYAHVDPGASAIRLHTDGSSGSMPTLTLGVGPASHLTIATTGNVGVGVTAPTARLHVGGNVVVDGNIGAKYQDVAEWVDAIEPIAAGTVVSAATGRVNHVQATAAAYDTAVAGVISAQPGILLGEHAAGKVAVAQSGRVRVKVDASYGAIKPGDLLVSSPRPGYAMRSEAIAIGGVSIHRPGTILGKALEPLESGTGDVLTLLTLQ